MSHSLLLYVVIKNPHQQQHSWYMWSSWKQSSDIYICEKWLFLLVEVLQKIIFLYHLAQLHGHGLKSRCISWQTTIRINCMVSNSVSAQYRVKWAQERLQKSRGKGNVMLGGYDLFIWYHVSNLAVWRNKILFGPNDFCNVKMLSPILILGNESYCDLRSRTCSCLKCWNTPRTSVAIKDCGQFLFLSDLERNLVFSDLFCLVCADLTLQVNIFFCSSGMWNVGNKILAMLLPFICD